MRAIHNGMSLFKAGDELLAVNGQSLDRWNKFSQTDLGLGLGHTNTNTNDDGMPHENRLSFARYMLQQATQQAHKGTAVLHNWVNVSTAKITQATTTQATAYNTLAALAFPSPDTMTSNVLLLVPWPRA